MQTTDSQYIDVKTAQVEYKIHPATVRKYVEQGLIMDAYRLGFHGKLYVAREGLVALLRPFKKGNSNA